MSLFDKALKGPWKTAGDDLQYKVDGNLMAFQCSASTSDWLYNFDFASAPYRDCGWKVHRGFKRIWKSAEDEILPLLLSLINPIILGYSHGADVALLAHEAYWWKWKVQPFTNTFGGARLVVGANKEVRSRFSNATVYRVNGDPVTMAPFKWMGYQDVGNVQDLGPWSLPNINKHKPDAYRKYL